RRQCCPATCSLVSRAWCRIDDDDEGARGRAVPVDAGEGEDRADPCGEQATAPLLRLHEHSLPVGAPPYRPHCLLPQLPELRRHLLPLLHRLLGRPTLGTPNPRLRGRSPRRWDRRSR
ncbi:unnamed protein product, partial [Musa textilis]